MSERERGVAFEREVNRAVAADDRERRPTDACGEPEPAGEAARGGVHGDHRDAWLSTRAAERPDRPIMLSEKSLERDGSRHRSAGRLDDGL